VRDPEAGAGLQVVDLSVPKDQVVGWRNEKRANAWGSIVNVFNRLRGKGKGNSKVHPAPTPTQDALGLDHMGHTILF
jgi:hypothetical protein